MSVFRAEAEGFEPPEPVKVQRFSRPPLSTTQPHLRGGLLVIFGECGKFFFQKKGMTQLGMRFSGCVCDCLGAVLAVLGGLWYVCLGWLEHPFGAFAIVTL